MLTPRANSLTCRPKDLLLVIDGTDFRDWSMSWMYLCCPSAIFLCECTRSCRKRQMQVGEEEPSQGGAQSQLERSLMASSPASPSHRESESSSTVSARRPVPLVSRDATMSRSLDAWADRAQNLSLGETRCGVKRKFGDPTLYHNPTTKSTCCGKSRPYGTCVKHLKSWPSSVPCSSSIVGEIV